MSKFINTQYKNTIDSLVDGLKAKLDNPYYIFTDKKACIVDYYNRNINKSTLDEGTKHVYSPIGDNSPTKYNLIKDAYLYGIERMVVNLNNDEYGLESDPIEGDAIVLPNTFIPYPDDYFVIIHTDQKLLFRVLAVTTDTLENGANFYRLQYKLDRLDDSDIVKLVDGEYRMIINNIGTNFKAVIRSNDYELIEVLDNDILTLKKYYKSLFYNNKVQTFTFMLNNNYFYDPFMIEFLIRNKILEGDDEYTYISHQAVLPKTFAIDYDKTFFRSIELQDPKKISYNNSAIGVAISDVHSLMSCRLETYFMLQYQYNPSGLNNQITIFDPDMLEKIRNNEYYEIGDDKFIYNFIIAYFNNKPIDSKMVKLIEDIDYNTNLTIFYLVPILIYVLEHYIKNLLK